MGCGDSECAANETCADCPADCGICCGNGEVDEGEECDDGNGDDWDGCTGCGITEFRISQSATGLSPAVASYLDGSYITVWTGAVPDSGMASQLWSRAYKADGTANGGELALDTVLESTPQRPDVATFQDGKAVVVWDWAGVIYGHILSAGGEQVGNENQVSLGVSSPTYTSASVATLSNGSFLTVFDGTNTNYDVMATIRKMDGTLVNSWLVPAKNIKSAYPQVSSIPGYGGFVVTWAGHGPLNEPTIRAQRLNSSGAEIGAEFAIWEVVTAYSPVVAVSSSGVGLAAWGSSQNDIYGKVFNVSGTVTGEAFQINTFADNVQADAAVCALSDNRFVVVWRSEEQDETGGGVFGQILSAGGEKVGGEFQANTYAIGSQIEPDVAALSGGAFVVVWRGPVPGDSGIGIFAQRFDKDGNKIYH